LTSRIDFNNTFGFTHDSEDSLKSFVTSSDVDANRATSEGIQLKPKQNVLYDDARLVSSFSARGIHHLTTGVAVTWGRTTASGIGFDFDYSLLPLPAVPDFSQIQPGDHRSFNDRRTFV